MGEARLTHQVERDPEPTKRERELVDMVIHPRYNGTEGF
jgi:hypothetical protein